MRFTISYLACGTFVASGAFGLDCDRRATPPEVAGNYFVRREWYARQSGVTLLKHLEKLPKPDG
jgi:hypothetical protein